MAFYPRPEQAEAIAYQGGKLAVVAVPGSGKTTTLSYLAARLVAEGGLRADQEILIVTMSNSAAENFSRQVDQFVQSAFGLPPRLGYRVRTLHGLAHEIIQLRPELLQLDTAFEILDETESERLIAESVRSYVKNAPAWYYELDSNPDSAYHRRGDWLDLLNRAASAFIKKAKDEGVSPSDIRPAALDGLVLAQACLAIYTSYEQVLRYRGALDFADLMSGALSVLRQDTQLLGVLQARWPYVLEDEAQDSSLAQEQMLRLITRKTGNWVRVGDPNQAIYETFTTANPEHLRRFMREDGVRVIVFPHSGRSSRSIIGVANALIEWSENHPHPLVREAQPLMPPRILPVPEGDLQANPVDKGRAVYLSLDVMSADEERRRIAQHLRRTLDAGGEIRAAILVPRNQSGAEMAKALQAEKVEFREMLKNPSSARQAAHVLSAMVSYLASPVDFGRLGRAFDAYLGVSLTEEAVVLALEEAQALFGVLKKRFQPEDVFFGDESRLVEAVEPVTARSDELGRLFWTFRRLMTRWLWASHLPIYELMLTIGREVFAEPVDLAIVHALSLTLRRTAEREMPWGLKQYARELERIAENRSSAYAFEGSDDRDEGDGRVTITTIHRAKGLEWDRVYLTSVNTYDFPSGEAQDTYMGEREFVRGNLDVVQEAVAQLEAVIRGLPYVSGEATERARIAYISERIRLLYVGMTRARRELFVTCNEGRGQARPALALVALERYWEERGQADA
jgi:DNA helicase-2/ATP-dependent DNA helicase PcrA